MRFLKLLDPNDPKYVGRIEGVGEQQTNARKLFPGLVTQSPFNYWRPEDPITLCSCRILFGIALFSGVELRLLDLMSDFVKVNFDNKLRIDVFDIDDFVVGQKITGQNITNVPEYFPDLEKCIVTPLLGIWENGTYIRVYSSYDACVSIIDRFNINMTVKELHESVSPPSRDMYDD